jgi:hypothetical protein
MKNLVVLRPFYRSLLGSVHSRQLSVAIPADPDGEYRETNYRVRFSVFERSTDCPILTFRSNSLLTKQKLSCMGEKAEMVV